MKDALPGAATALPPVLKAVVARSDAAVGAGAVGAHQGRHVVVVVGGGGVGKVVLLLLGRVALPPRQRVRPGRDTGWQRVDLGGHRDRRGELRQGIRLAREAVEAAQAGQTGQAQPLQSPSPSPSSSSAPGVGVVLGQLLPPPVPLGVLRGLEPLSDQNMGIPLLDNLLRKRIDKWSFVGCRVGQVICVHIKDNQ